MTCHVRKKRKHIYALVKPQKSPNTQGGQRKKKAVMSFLGEKKFSPGTKKKILQVVRKKDDQIPSRGGRGRVTYSTTRQAVSSRRKKRVTSSMRSEKTSREGEGWARIPGQSVAKEKKKKKTYIFLKL